MIALKDLAKHAAHKRIRGRSYKRNSLLKPLDILLEKIERYPDEIGFACDSSKEEINDHIRRVSKGVHTEDIYAYVDLFREEVLNKTLHSNVNKLLQRERDIRSAYLLYVREELANIFLSQKKANTTDEALQTLEYDNVEEQDEEE